MTETELEKKWRKVFELALNESDGRVSLKINEEPDGWVTVRSFTAPTYKTPYKRRRRVLPATARHFRRVVHDASEVT